MRNLESKPSAPNGLADRVEFGRCERPEARAGRIFDVSDRQLAAPRMRRSQLLVPLLATMCFMVAPSRALAAPNLFVDLKYDVAPALEGCPSADDFRNIVGQQLGYDPYRADAPLHVVVRAQAVERGIEGVIDWNAPTQERAGERRFTSRNRDCYELMAVMGFVVAVQIRLLATDLTAGSGSTRPGADATAPTSGAETAAAQPKPPELPESPPPVEIPSSAFGSRWSAVAGLGPAAGFGLAPNLVALGRIFFGLKFEAASIELGAEASLPTTTHWTGGVGFRQNLILGTVAACGHYRFASACALGKFGQIRVRGLGVDVPSSPTGFLAQAGPRLAATVGLGDQLFLLAHADALVLLSSWTVELNHTNIWTMPRFGAVLGIDLALRF